MSYVSDLNTGLMSLFPTVYDEPLHFLFCLYHLMINLKDHKCVGWNSEKCTNLVKMFKECVYAPNIRIFNEKVATFKEIGGKKTEEWLLELPYDKWVVAHSTCMR